MPRGSRKRSKSGIYHIMLRGINRQVIFVDKEDMEKLLETVEKYKEVSKYSIFAYCIMGNHIHMLIKEQEESISNAIKRISSSYVFWYNKKYDRCGHLFQERFKSEAVEDEEYFLTVLRYIHQNPVKAGMVKSVDEYRWSSYNNYIESTGISDTDFALDMFSSDKKKAMELFKNFNKQDNSDMCLEDEEKPRISDSEMGEYFRKAGVANPKELRQLEKDRRNEIIKQIKLVKGVTIRQLSRITGIAKSVIDRA